MSEVEPRRASDHGPLSDQTAAPAAQDGPEPHRRRSPRVSDGQRSSPNGPGGPEDGPRRLHEEPDECPKRPNL
eukprot:5493780-Pyramimonas_sp.AAC.1